MKSNIFIPEKINVGFQERSDTYTKQLAYIIYYDEKGKLRKEASWNSWRNKEIEPKEFENVPTEGFVLNKKVGGYSSGWNHRQTYVRVYDPRGFEFEIDVVNLLYILENTNSIKGKGLEGEFVYGWDGKELILIPTSSPDYEEIQNYNKMVHSEVKLKGKDLNLGGTYITKQNEEWIYLGRFDVWDNPSEWSDSLRRYVKTGDVNKGKYYWFFRKNDSEEIGRYYFEYIKSLSNKIIGVVDDTCVENYSELIDVMETHCKYSPIDETKNEYLPYTFEEIEALYNNYGYTFEFYNESGDLTKLSRTYSSNKDKGNYYVSEDYYEEEKYWGGIRKIPKFKYTYFTSGKQIFETYRPHYKNTYLRNGKLYSEGKLNDKK